jgi:hypothetical protein
MERTRSLDGKITGNVYRIMVRILREGWLLEDGGDGRRIILRQIFDDL